MRPLSIWWKWRVCRKFWSFFSVFLLRSTLLRNNDFLFNIIFFFHFFLILIIINIIFFILIRCSFHSLLLTNKIIVCKSESSILVLVLFSISIAYASRIFSFDSTIIIFIFYCWICIRLRCSFIWLNRLFSSLFRIIIDFLNFANTTSNNSNTIIVYNIIVDHFTFLFLQC